MRKKNRVIIDRSAFSEYEALRTSNIVDCVKRGHVHICHTPVFLEETLQCAENNSSLLRDQTPFILEIANGGWFKDKDTLWREELTGTGDVNPLINRKLRRRAEKQWQNFIKNPVIPQKTSQKQETNCQKKEALRDLRKGMRDEKKVGKWNGAFSDYLQSIANTEFLELGEAAIDVHVTTAQAIKDKWKKSPADYPFFTSFLKGAFFGFYSAMTSNAKIDGNHEKDAEHLSYLAYSDIVVSNDEKSMRPTFDAVWKPKGKTFYTAQEFITFLGSLTVI